MIRGRTLVVLIVLLSLLTGFLAYRLVLKQRSASLGEELIQAIRSNDGAKARRLVEQGADINARDPETGRTVLTLAIVHYLNDSAGGLLERGADINARDTSGMTPLMCAAMWGNVEGVKLLLAFHADVNATDLNGTTALQWARNGDPRIVEPLRQAGATER